MDRERKECPAERTGAGARSPAGARTSAAALGASTGASAHRGFGLFDRSKDVRFTGVITGIDSSIRTLICISPPSDANYWPQNNRHLEA